jgi:hypothetical protein
MSNETAVANGFVEAERRVNAMEVLCEILAGQVKGERRQLAEIKAALASPVPGSGANAPAVPPGDISPEMLG